MKNKDKKLKVDLDFLDVKTPKPKQTVHHESTISSKVSRSRKWNWKTIFIVVGIIVFSIWIYAFEDTTSSSNSPTNNSQVKSALSDDDIEYGEYRCSQQHYDKAVSLSPGESETTLNAALLLMENRANELERLERNIEYSYVNEYSEQWEIDSYNDEIDTYNSKLASYKRDAAALDTRIDRFNSQIEAHNKYLVQNCTRR